MITVLFFAQLREQLGHDKLTLHSAFYDIGALRHYLMAQHKEWQAYLAPDNSLAAVNQCLVNDHHPLHSGDEVAFFPPVTGG
ncbi:molybdopterin synthase sulfur carrier subunit [Bowmanella denitrificans]|uniref:Molybdopterin synthase sulfur carrier subunit n=1 Tax=Bowmanella denitrificans TaxID=366582 RepID=A0ABN0WWI6_9ALTE|nr:molybdopterin synthase sulfur carrier subunit [Bowmanella denitrificans]